MPEVQENASNKVCCSSVYLLYGHCLNCFQPYATAPSDMKPWPKFIQDRIDLWDRLMEEYKAEIAAKVCFHPFFF